MAGITILTPLPLLRHQEALGVGGVVAARPHCPPGHQPQLYCSPSSRFPIRSTSSSSSSSSSSSIAETTVMAEVVVVGAVGVAVGAAAV